jgi:uncharacterized protein (TIGR02996 family)
MLHTDSDFLSAIAAQPTDRTLRLVYADWLDEQSQPHGELIRVEEEMRELPVFSDRFWELKPRRNELRAQVGAEWCGQMRYGTECEPVFRHGIPDGWRERWRLIREFTERWHRVPMPDVGGRQKEIAEAEVGLGRKLPPSVREWIAFNADAERAPGDGWKPFWNPYLKGSDEFVGRSNRDHAIVVREGEGFDWGVRFIDFHVPDPPVYMVVSGKRADHNSSVEPTADTLTADCLESYGGSSLLTADMLSTRTTDTATLQQQLFAACGPPQVFRNAFLFEATNLFVYVTPADWTSEVRLYVVVSLGTKREQVPAFLWNYASALNSRGMFATR